MMHKPGSSGRVKRALHGAGSEVPFMVSVAIPAGLWIFTIPARWQGWSKENVLVLGLHLFSLTVLTCGWLYCLLIVRFYRHPLGIWGYFWRGAVVTQASLVVAAKNAGSFLLLIDKNGRDRVSLSANGALPLLVLANEDGQVVYSKP